MKYLRNKQFILCVILILALNLMLGCASNAAQKKQSVPITVASNEDIVTSKGSDEVSVWKLSANALATYSFLLYDQALRQEDKKTLLYALRELSRFNPPATVFIDAGILFMEGDPQPILPLIQVALKRFPDNVSLNLLNAELLQKAGKSSEAIERIRDFGKRHPDNTDAKLELALLLVNSGKHKEAEDLLNNIVGAERTALVEYYHAKALIGMKRIKEALPYLEKALMEMPSFTEALMDLAFVYESTNDFANAREIYEELLEQVGYNPEIILRLVHTSLRLKEPKKALEYYEEGPVSPILSATIGSMLVEEKYYDLAEPLLKKLTTLPDAPQELYFYLAAIAFERDKDSQKTYDLLSNITIDNPDYLRAVLLRLQLLLDMLEFDEALNLVKDAQKNMPDKKELLVAEVRILATLERMDEAKAFSLRNKEKWPKDLEIAFLHASLLDEMDDKNGALKVMEEIVKQNPNHFQALNYIGYTLADENRDINRAIQLLQKAVSLSPRSGYILDSLAWAFFRNKQFDLAWETINKVIAMDATDDPIIWEHYAIIARVLGKKSEAKKGYTKALELDPDNHEIIKQLEDL